MGLSVFAQKKTALARGRKMAYVDRGVGDVLLFLHGNPTSSFLWRNVLGPLSARARCIAPDLIGMGDSDKLERSGPDSYSFFEHRAFLDAFLDALKLDRQVVLVVHDWGSALGLDWARRHSERVRAIVYTEAIVGMIHWSEYTPERRALFERLRSPEGERMVLEDNAFVERILPSGILRELTPEELEEYRRPYRTPGESRRPTLSWPRQLPIDGSPLPSHPEGRAIARRERASRSAGTPRSSCPEATAVRRHAGRVCHPWHTAAHAVDETRRAFPLELRGTPLA